MNRYTFYIAMSVFCIVFPAVAWLAAIWHEQQPKLGAVGNGPQGMRWYEWFPLVSTMLLGVLNLPFAIRNYRNYKKSRPGPNPDPRDSEPADEGSNNKPGCTRQSDDCGDG
jgi:hypothetical protein